MRIFRASDCAFESLSVVCQILFCYFNFIPINRQYGIKSMLVASASAAAYIKQYFVIRLERKTAVFVTETDHVIV